MKTHRPERRRQDPYQWAWGFFGLPSNYSVILHQQIFELCYYGNGFTQEGVYRLPVHLRNFYYKKLLEAKKLEQEQVKKQNKSKGSSPKGPNIRVRK
jgi:hypothetical protein